MEQTETGDQPGPLLDEFPIPNYYVFFLILFYSSSHREGHGVEWGVMVPFYDLWVAGATGKTSMVSRMVLGHQT